MRKSFYLTTPIYYPSGNLHIGHSYTTVAADALCRYKRLKGFDVMFLTGTDEHGQKIERKAKAAGITPKVYVDNIVVGIKSLWNTLDIKYDRFIRTTDEEHEAAIKYIFQKLYDKGDIYKSEYEGWYCTPCESFWTETQLVDGKCPDCKRPVERTREESYFFRISKYQQALIDLFEQNPDFIQPASRANEMLNNFLRPGLDDLCVSRTTFDWGVKVPFDDKHVVYVWIDALSNYITALGYPDDQNGDFAKYWPADVHLVGKEIVRFHTIIWPAMLMALDIPLPKKIFGHGWLLLDGGKISKSKENNTANIVDPVILCNRYGVDAVRYFLLREVPFGSDGIFTNELLVQRTNSDLANDLGNLVSRTSAMIEKYFAGIIPEDKLSDSLDNELVDMGGKLLSKVEDSMEKLQFSVALSEIWKVIARCNKYIDETAPWVLAKDTTNNPRLAMVMFNLAESIRIISILLLPFMPKSSPLIWENMGIEDASICSWDSASKFGLYQTHSGIKKMPVMFPRIDLAKELEELSKLNENANSDSNDNESDDLAQKAKSNGADVGSRNPDKDSAENNNKNNNNNNNIGNNNVNNDRNNTKNETSSNDKNNNVTEKEKASNSKTMDEKSINLANLANSPEQTEGVAYIDFTDFTKVEIKTGKILECEKVTGSEKLLQSKIDIGNETRQVLSGIAKWYTPEEMTGKTVILVTNLKPRKMMGKESNGMILCASTSSGALKILTVEGDIEPGAEVG